jgi:DsbC/DsbD-like thiol-disulfide interchange protein
VPVLRSLLLLLLALPGPPDASLIKARHVEIAVRPAGAASFAAGATALLRLEVRPKPGRYLYAPGQAGYVGFTLTFDAASGITAGKLEFPKPEPYVFEPTGERLEVFRRAFEITQPITFTRATAAPIAATLRYQACDTDVCYRPEDVRVEWR